MKNLKMIIRSLFRRGESNSIKILSLSIGITMGLILIAKVLFEYSYDNFYPDADRIYACLLYTSASDNPSFREICLK